MCHLYTHGPIVGWLENDIEITSEPKETKQDKEEGSTKDRRSRFHTFLWARERAAMQI